MLTGWNAAIRKDNTDSPQTEKHPFLSVPLHARTASTAFHCLVRAARARTPASASAFNCARRPSLLPCLPSSSAPQLPRLDLASTSPRPHLDLTRDLIRARPLCCSPSFLYRPRNGQAHCLSPHHTQLFRRALTTYPGASTSTQIFRAHLLQPASRSPHHVCHL